MFKYFHRSDFMLCIFPDYLNRFKLIDERSFKLYVICKLPTRGASDKYHYS